MKRMAWWVVLSLMILSAQAGTLRWDADTVTPGPQDGGGLWSGADANWWDEVNLVNVAWTGSLDTASIGAGGQAGDITNAGVTLAGLVFEPTASGNYRIVSNIITLAGTPVITANADATLATLLAGTAFVKTGPSTLTLNPAGTNTYAGAIAVSGGVLAVSGSFGDATIRGDVTVDAGAALQLDTANRVINAALITVNAGGEFRVNQAETVANIAGGGLVTNTTGTNRTLALIGSGTGTVSTFNGTIAGPVALNGSGTAGGTLVLSGTNSYTGQTIVNNLNLRVLDSGALGATNGNTDIQGQETSFASLELGNNITLTEPILLRMRKDENGLFAGFAPHIRNIEGTNTLAGTITLESGGTFWTLQSDTGRLTIASTLQSFATGGRTVRLGGAAEVEAAGLIQNGASSAFGVIKFGTGILSYARTNTYTGLTTVEAGTLSFGTSGGIANAAEIRVLDGATLDASGVAPYGLLSGQNLTGGGSVTGSIVGVSGARVSPGVASVADTLSFANDLSLSGATAWFDLTPSTTEGAGTNDLVNVAGNLDGAGSTVSIVPRGALATNAPYVLFNYDGSLLNPFAGLSVPASQYAGVLDTTSSPGQVLATFSGSASNLVWSGGGTDWDAGISLNWNADTAAFLVPDAVRFDDTAPANYQVNLVGTLYPSDVVVDSTSNYTFGGSGRISGLTGLRKAGSGALVISNANDFTGPVRVEGGTLALGNAAAWGAASGSVVVVTNGGTLDLRGLALNGQSKDVRISGAGVGGLGAIVSSGAQQLNALRGLTLEGDATIGTSSSRWDIRSANYGDALNLNGFTLTKTGAPTNGLIQVTMTNSGSIVVAQGGLTVSRAAVDGPGTVRLLQDTTLLLDTYSTNRFEKAIVSSGATIRVIGSSFVSGAPLALEGGTTVDVATVTFTLTNVISGSISNDAFVKAGSGVLVLSAANTYTGTTTIRAGTLSLTGGDHRLPTNTTVNFTAASTLNVISNAQTIGSMTVPANSTVTLTVGGGGSLTLDRAADLQLGPGGVNLSSSQHIITDLSGLGAFTYAAATNIFRVGLKAGSTNAGGMGSVATVTLGGSNLIRAATVAVGDQGASNDGGLSTLHLGTANDLRANLLNVGYSGRSDAVIDFAASLAAPSVTIRGQDGVSPLPVWRIGRVGQFGGAGQTVFSAAVNLTGGVVNASVGSLFVAEADTQGATSRAGTQNGLFAMGAGTLSAGTVTVGRVAGGGNLTGAYAARGTFTVAHASATVDIGTINFAENTITASGGNSRTAVGTLNLVEGTLRASLIQLGLQTGSGTATAEIRWTAGTLENLAGGDLTIHRVPITLLSTAPIFRVAGTNVLTMTAQTPLGGVGGFTKDGTGHLVLAGTNGHAGPTVVTAGTLRVDGSFTGGSTITVRNGGVLAGTGVVAAVSVENGGVLAPGASIGTLNAGGVVLQAGAFTVMEVDRAGPTGDVLVATNVTYGGTLVISNTAAALQAGDSFKLFDSASYGGTFAAIDPALPGAGLQWDVSNLTSSGILAVATASTPPPTNAPISASVRIGTNWLISLATESNVNYVMQSNTNLFDGSGWQSLATNLGTGSTMTNAIPLDPLKRQDFIRYIVP